MPDATIAKSIYPQRLFVLAVLALFTAGAAFALRASIATDLRILYLVPIDDIHATRMAGEILGAAFIGFATTLFFSSPLLDVVGMRKMMVIAAACFSGGVGLLLFCDTVADGSEIYWVLWISMLLMGIAWGCVEATINPLITALYPTKKTEKMNILHAWWPAGIVIGGLLALALDGADIGWKTKISLLFIPSVLIIIMAARMTFPMTERAAAGISWADMMKEVYRSPSFLIWIVAMFLAAGSELAPGQFVDLVLTNTVGMRGILLLVYVSAIMFVMRHFAGFIVHKISPVTLMAICSVLTAIGLYALSVASSPVSAFVAATIWAGGVCFLWPTILASVSERYPRGGSFFIGIVATVGALSSTIILPYMGAIYDQAKLDYAGSAEALQTLEGQDLQNALAHAATGTFQTIALLPIILLIILMIIWCFDKKRGVSLDKSAAYEVK